MCIRDRLYPGLGRDDRHRIRDLFVLPHEKVALRCAVGAFLADDAGKFRDFDFLCTKIPGGTRDLADINPCADCANIPIENRR